MRAVGAGLAGDADAARHRPAAVERRGERRVIGPSRVEHAQAVGPEDAHAVPRAPWRPSSPAPTAPASSISAKPAVNITTALTPRLRQVLDRRRGEFGRHRDDRHVGRFRQIGDRRIGFQPLDFRPVRIDRIKPAGESLRAHIGDRPAADPRRIGGSAEDGDGAGRQKWRQAGETRHDVGRFPWFVDGDSAAANYPGPGVSASQPRPRPAEFDLRGLCQSSAHHRSART